MTNISKVKTRTCSDPPVCLHTHTQSHVSGAVVKWTSPLLSVRSLIPVSITPRSQNLTFQTKTLRRTTFWGGTSTHVQVAAVTWTINPPSWPPRPCSAAGDFKWDSFSHLWPLTSHRRLSQSSDLKNPKHSDFSDWLSECLDFHEMKSKDREWFFLCLS